MLDAAKTAVATLKIYVKAEEASIDLEDEMATAIHRLLEAASKQDWDVAVVYNAYMTWLEEK